ncbi:uncharacterized protein N7515_004781 [Penicillium bovifimosum]|uniref:Uncharacterized protein n=1 Tax=Penicillium bovifimosum TaxID=126998 RepID=A0A9W9H2C1_9EURO|nr:uncharacterized protein N7515_004781 [Penicillium bovifimosum]KAJ5135503.1 hypothetical protein N7515_004781 [Penicillium bovifimosum]
MFAAAQIDIKNIIAIHPHDQKGWMVECTSPEAALAAAGKSFTLREYTVWANIYVSSGASLYKADTTKSNLGMGELAKNVASNPVVKARKASFWTGSEERRGTGAGVVPILFQQPPELLASTCRLENPGP